MRGYIITIIAVAVVVVLTLVATGLYFILRPNPYCDPSLCVTGQAHIGCYGNVWGPACENPEVITITSDMEQEIIDAHDQYRDDVASGFLKNKYGEKFPMANRMGVLKWNNELAYLAELNTYQCIMQHDKCRNTKEFKFSGQNLGYGTASGDPISFIHTIITAWFNEYNDTHTAVINSYASPPASEKVQIGHFTAMIQDLQTDIGCGIISTMKNNRKYFVFACNYSYTNMVGSPVYVADKSAVPCYGCTKGCHLNYHYLCAKGELIYAPSNTQQSGQSTKPNPYCDSSLCRAGQPHIGCYGNEWSPACASPKVITITSDMEQKILDAHDQYRNIVASGKLKNKYGETFPMAKRMGVLKWNTELAYLAKLNTYQCIMQHDKCRNTKEFKFSGQNLGFGTASGDPISFIQTIITAWYNEYNDTRIAVINSYASPPASEKVQIGHFTAMIQDLQTDIGCGMISTMKNNRKYFAFACNYSYTNMLGSPIYGSGKSCSGCTKGCNLKYPSLCVAGEPIHPPSN